MQAFAFADLRTISATSYRGVITLRMVAVDEQQFTVRLDARFGNARQVAQRILTDCSQFAAAPRLSTPREL
jgi:hypothetical protein